MGIRLKWTKAETPRNIKKKENTEGKGEGETKGRRREEEGGKGRRSQVQSE